MTSFIKIILRLLPLGIVLSIATTYHLPSNIAYINNVGESAVEVRISRHPRAIKPASTRYCKLNQYYDQEEGRCLGVPGGGKVLHIENERSCGVNVLKPHCTSSLYYHICKHDKSILAQCANRQIFDNRLQRCVSSNLTPSTIRPDDHEYYDHVKELINCTRRGRFPVPGYCFMFYVCETNGHRFYQSVFKCPQNTGYQADKEICAAVPNCENNDSVSSTVCVPDAPGENVESLNLDEVTEENIERTSEISEESKILSENDPVVKGEENANFKTYDDNISITPASAINNPVSVDNYEDNDSNTDNVSSNNANTLSTQPIEDVSVPDNIETSMPNQTPNPIESAQEAPDEIQNEEGKLSTAELDNDAPHSIMASMSSTTPEYKTNVDLNSNLDNETTDSAPSSSDSYALLKSDGETQAVTTEQYKSDDETVTLSNSNIAPIEQDLTSTISNIPELSPISDTPLKDEETQDVTTEDYRHNEDSSVTLSHSNTETIDQDPTSTISNIAEVSSISDSPLKTIEEMKDVITEQYKNNEDSTVTPSYSNTEAVDQDPTSRVNNMPESSLTSNTPPISDEQMQDVTTEQYRNYDDRAATPNSNIEVVDQDPISVLNDVPATTDLNSNDFNTPLSTSISATSSPQAAVDDDEHTTEGLAETSSIYKSANTDLHAPEEVESVSTPYSLEHADGLDLIPTTRSTLTLEHVTGMDIVNTTPNIQDLSATLDTNMAKENVEDSTETSPASFTEQDVPVTNSYIS